MPLIGPASEASLSVLSPSIHPEDKSKKGGKKQRPSIHITDVISLSPSELNYSYSPTAYLINEGGREWRKERSSVDRAEE